MKTIITDELRRSFLTIKSAVMILIFLGIAFLVGKYADVISFVSDGKSAIVTGMFAGFTFFGTLFSFILYASNLTKDIETESIRYVTPYVSRRAIYLGKFFAMLFYFLSLIFISLIVLFIARKTFFFPWLDLLIITVFFFYVESLVLLLSILFKTSKTANFAGICLGVSFPIIAALSLEFKNIFFQILSWLLPYRYIDGTWEIVILFLISFVILLGGLVIFERKEL